MDYCSPHPGSKLKGTNTKCKKQIQSLISLVYSRPQQIPEPLSIGEQQQIQSKIEPRHHFPQVQLTRLSTDAPFSKTSPTRPSRVIKTRTSQFFKNARLRQKQNESRNHRDHQLFSPRTSLKPKKPYAKSNLECHLCHVKLSYQFEMTRHMRSHEGQVANPYLCPLCQQTFHTANLLKFHQIEEHAYKYRLHFLPNSPQQRMYRMAMTSISVRDIVTANENKIKLMVVAPKLLCPHCPSKFPYTSGLKRHLISCHTKKLIVCPKCGSPFKSIPHLTAHQAKNVCDIQNEINSRRVFQCDKCEMKLTTEKGKWTHMRKHHGIFKGRVKNYPCLFCEFKTHRAAELEAHNRSHTGEKPFPCRACNKPFSTAPNALQHTKFYCAEARKLGLSVTSRTKPGLSTGIKVTPSKVLKPCFKCSLCEQTFSGDLVRKRHEAKHGDKFPCPFCPAKFNHHSVLATHKKTLHFEQLEDLPCPSCQMTFKTKNALVEHRITAHNRSGVGIRKNKKVPSNVVVGPHVFVQVPSKSSKNLSQGKQVRRLKTPMVDPLAPLDGQ